MKKVNQCLILAAGNGTRIRTISGGLPKPLVDFRGKPIIEHIVQRAHRAGIESFVIVVGYRSDLIRNWSRIRGVGDSVNMDDGSGFGLVKVGQLSLYEVLTHCLGHRQRLRSDLPRRDVMSGNSPPRQGFGWD